MQGYLENGVNSVNNAFDSNTNTASSSGNYKLSVLGPTPSIIINTSSGSKQRPTQRPSSQPLSICGTVSSVLRFAYVPLHDTRGGATLEAGLRGRRSKSSAGVPAASETSSGGAGRRNGGGGPGEAATGIGSVGEGLIGRRNNAGDAGSWNASMQALCAILRARRRDLELAGLVFLALESCVSEWAQACDVGSELTVPCGGGGGWRPLYLGPKAITTATSSASGKGAGGAAVSGGGAPCTVFSGATAVTASGLSTVSQHQRSHPPVALAGAQGGRGVVGPREKEMMAAAAARGKMQLGSRESLKAGLMWAEAVPLGRSRPAAVSDGADQRDTAPGSSGDGGPSSQLSQGTTLEVVGGEVAFSAAMADAVERLCR